MRAYTDRMTRMVSCSGKLVLLDKLLPKLKAEGHKVCVCPFPCVCEHARVRARSLD